MASCSRSRRWCSPDISSPLGRRGKHVSITDRDTLALIEFGWEVFPVALDRERIVAEAVALLDAEGLDGVTTRKLAARLGVQSPTLYWHLPNKAALVTALA